MVCKWVLIHFESFAQADPLPRLQKINFRDQPSLFWFFLYMMRYDSWVMSQRNIFKNVPAQSCPISLGTNLCRYHGAVVSIPFQMKFEVNDHVEIPPLYLKINLVQKLRALSGWIFLTKYPVCCDKNIKVFGHDRHRILIRLKSCQ